jgi:hypothetical protein
MNTIFVGGLASSRWVPNSFIENKMPFLGASAKLRKVTVSVAMSARPSAWKNSAAIARILMNFDI